MLVDKYPSMFWHQIVTVLNLWFIITVYKTTDGQEYLINLTPFIHLHFLMML